VLEAVTGFHVHRGALASFGRLPLRSPRTSSPRARVVVMERVTNHTNLGAVFRSAAALGMDAVLLSPDSCDPLYRRCVRVSMGRSSRCPTPTSTTGRRRRRRAGGRLPGARLTPHPTATDLAQVRVAPDDKVALLFGAEGPGA
jgi:tRNA G18 (ribose-2'-O)-methylase SpoU